MAKVEGTEQITEALEAAISGEAESAAAEETSEEVVETSEEPRTHTIPKPRFDEVIGERNQLREQLGTFESEKSELSSTVARLSNLLDSSKEDSDLVNEIRSLINHDNPKVVDAVQLINNVLLGVEEEVEAGEIQPEQAIQRTRDLIDDTRYELEDQLADARADQIVNRADQLADKWLSSLPEDYTEGDRSVIAHLWTDMVDWDGVEAEPGQLDTVLAETFQQAIDTFGVPRGSLYSAEEIEELTNEIEAPDEITPEEELAELVAEKDYSGFHPVEMPGGKIVHQPVMTDDEFAAELAESMKIANG